MKTLLNVAFFLLLLSLAGFLPGMTSPLPIIGVTPMGLATLLCIGWAAYDLFIAPLLDGIKVEDKGEGEQLSYTIKGRKALMVQLLASGWSRLFSARKAEKKDGEKEEFEKKINLS
jgi:hypothetical protein